MSDKEPVVLEPVAPEQDCADIEEIKEMLVELNKKIDYVFHAFPTDEQGVVDVYGHRKYHDTLIKTAESERDFWIALKRDLLTKGLWTIIVIAVGLIAYGVLHKISDSIGGVGA